VQLAVFLLDQLSVEEDVALIEFGDAVRFSCGGAADAVAAVKAKTRGTYAASLRFMGTSSGRAARRPRECGVE